MATLEDQLALERSMAERGAGAYMASVHRAQSAGRESETGYGLSLLSNSVDKLAGHIEEWVMASDEGGAGRWVIGARFLARIPAHISAYLGLRLVLDGISKHTRSATTLSVRIGRAVEAEVLARRAQEEAPRLVQKLVEQFKVRRTVNSKHKGRVIRGAVQRYNLASDWEGMARSEALQVGMTLLHLTASMGLIELIHAPTKKSSNGLMVTVPSRVLDWCQDRVARQALLQNALGPCIIPPLPWTTPFQGGYYSERLRLSVVKTREGAYLQELANTDTPLFYEALNALQNTAWRVNERVYRTMEALWDAGGGGPLPPTDNIPLPPKAESMEGETLIQWKRAASQVHTLNHTIKAKRLQVSYALATAAEYAEYPAIYYVWQVDFRGRAYPVSASPMHPQGSDIGRSLLEFAEAKPITAQDQLDWLYIHAANCAGEDKAPFADRIAWVEEHHDQIMATADDPLDTTWWREADSPWQFLAACFDLAGFWRQGWGYESRLPIAQDGTCNGLQHYSAMLRDPVGGRATNLVPGDRPSDIYGLVAERTLEIIQGLADQGDEDAEMAQSWLDWHGIDRKITKRPVMVLPYGGTMYACLKYVYEAVREKIAAGYPNPWGDDLPKASNWLAIRVWASIGDVVVAARQAMGWLQQTARILAKQGLPIWWATPVGFPVMQSYRVGTSTEVKTILSGNCRYKNHLPSSTAEVDPQAQAQGLPPNLVHSLDAAHMMLTTLRGKVEGISSWAMIHDSYGTHAADSPRLATVLRQAFVEMYASPILEDFAAQVQAQVGSDHPLPPLPVPGSLVLDVSVMGSRYFFA